MSREFHKICFVVGLLLAMASAGAAWAQGTYQIKSGDTLQVEVLEDPSLNRSVLVLPDGQVAFPLAGSLQAAGRSITQFRDALTSALESNFAAEPTVFVSVAQLAQTTNVPTVAKTISVYALGEFSVPGKYDVKPRTTLLQFLAASGGLTRFAATKRLQLRRFDARSGRERVYRFNYNDVERGARLPAELVLREGDVIVAPERRLFE